MPRSFQAVAVALLAVLPGALYIWAFEAQAGRWGVGLADRIPRFIGTSALFHAVFAAPEYWLFTNYIHRRGADGTFTAPLEIGTGLRWWLALVPVAYVFFPIIGGTLVGRGTLERRPWARWFTGPSPPPRAWDHLFGVRPAGVLRARLKTGEWIGGKYGAKSYTAGYPETPQDLYLEEAFLVEADGRFAITETGDYVVLGSGLLVRWEEILFIEFFHVEAKA